MRILLRYTLLIFFCAVPLFAPALQAQTADPTLPAGCKANLDSASEAETALYAESWFKAGRLFEKMAKENPASLEARAGLIRVELGRGNIADALKQATAMAKDSPQSAVAQAVLGETYVRRGEISVALPIVTKAISLDPCYGRARQQAARIESLSGYRASAARHLAQAHALDPNDEQITVAWLFSLPQEQRYPLLKDFLDHEKYLNSDDREDLKTNVLEGEAKLNSHCTVSSPAQGATTTVFETPGISHDPWRPSIDAMLNGKKHRLFLSTSDDDIVFPLSAAEKIGLTPIVKGSYARLYDGGRLNYYFANLASFRIGTVEFKNCIVKVVDESRGGNETRVESETNPSGADGSIGTMFLADFLLRLDPQKHQLGLLPLPPVPQNVDSKGLPFWSNVSKSGGDDVPSINGGNWAQYNRTISPEMKDWTSLVRDHDSMWLPTVIGPGPEVLFLFEFSSPWPRISTNASGQATTFETAVGKKSASTFHGYFFEFAGLVFPVDSWTVDRYDEFSKHTKLETSGDIGQDALRQTVFTLDLRDNLVQFVRIKK